jgi:GT2 family glycosyltransferase
MELSIIITHYRNPELLKVCIDSVKKNLTLEDYEIIVSDSATEEKTELMMREDYPEIKFLSSKKNIGFSGTVNRGLDIAKGEYVLILNGDVITKEKSIEKLLEFIKNNPDVGIVGPQLLNFNETLQPSSFRFYTPFTIIYRRTFLGKFGFAKKHLDAFMMKSFDHQSIKEVDWLMGSAMMTSRKAMEKVGFIDTRFKMYFEDTDWCRQFWEKRFKVVYYPEAKMYHYHGKGSAGKNVLQSLLFNRLSWTHIISAIKFFRKYWNKPLPKHN